MAYKLTLEKDACHCTFMTVPSRKICVPVDVFGHVKMPLLSLQHGVVGKGWYGVKVVDWPTATGIRQKTEIRKLKKH